MPWLCFYNWNFSTDLYKMQSNEALWETSRCLISLRWWRRALHRVTVRVTISSPHHHHHHHAPAAAAAAADDDDDAVGSTKRIVSSASVTRLILADQFCGVVSCTQAATDLVNSLVDEHRPPRSAVRSATNSSSTDIGFLLRPVAALRLVSPGAVTDGVRSHLFDLKKWWLFSHRPQCDDNIFLAIVRTSPSPSLHPRHVTPSHPVASLGEGGGRTAPGDTRRKKLWLNLQRIVDKRGRTGNKGAAWHPLGGDTRLRPIKVTVMTKNVAIFFRKNRGDTVSCCPGWHQP